MVQQTLPRFRRARLQLGALGILVIAACLYKQRSPSDHPPALTTTRAANATRPRASANTSASTLPASDGGICAPDATPSERLIATVAANAKREAAFAQVRAFESWLTDFRRADPTAAVSLTPKGRVLAEARRAGLKYLIETAPRRALEFALAADVRAELPTEVQSLLEQRLDARGNFEVVVSCYGTQTRTDHFVEVDGHRYAAYVFGRRDQEATKNNVPLHGILLDGAVALEETPYRLLDDGEKAALHLPELQLGVMVGNDAIPLADPADFKALAEHLIAAESAAGPHVLPTLFDSIDPRGGHLAHTAEITSPASWILGEKNVLWVRVDFSDAPGAVATDAQIAATDTALNDFYVATSYNKTSLKFTVLPATLRLTKEKAYYNTAANSTGEMATNAKALAKQYDVEHGGTGLYDPDRYDRWIILFSKIDAYTFAGQGLLGGATTWMHDTIAPSSAGHELGHNQSLDHAHAWLPSGSSPIGAGSLDEYGDLYDRMGTSGSSPNNYFNVAQKAKLGYLDETSIAAITQSGTYRLIRHDDKNATGIRALRVGAGNVEYDYWIEYRRTGPTAFTAGELDRLRNGVLLHWGPQKLPRFVTTKDGSYLLDMTPGSAAGMNDSALRIGETFTDPDAGITVKPVAVGGTAPNEYIDVQISFGAINGNHNPVLQAEPPTATVFARTNVSFSASATDQDGDPLYYRWDLGDNSIQPNLNTITSRFAKGGAYTVNVSAHDGKGGLAAKSFILNVVDPLLDWTHRGAGVTTNFLYDVTFAGGQFVAVGINNTILTSPDGITWTRIPSLPTGISFTGVTYDGSRYVVSGYRFTASATDRGVIAYSDNGVNWTIVTVASGQSQFWDVTYGAGRFVVIGDNGVVYHSTDGVAWAAAASPVTSKLRAVAFADGLFLAVGDSGRILSSSDGVTWANRSLATSATLLGITRYNKLWYVGQSNVSNYSSPDGITWTRVSAASGATPTTLLHLISTGGVLLGVGNNFNIGFTENGESWSMQQVDPTPTSFFQSVCEGNGLIVAVGSGGTIYTAASPAEFSAPLAAPSLRTVADSLKVSVGRKNIISAGGSGLSRLELYANGVKVSDINDQSGAFTWTPAAVGNYALTVRGVDATGASVVSSAYAAQAGLARWTWRNPGLTGADLQSAVRVGGKWWIVGNGGAFFTLDDSGTAQLVEFPTHQNLADIAYANGRFIVVGRYRDDAAHEDIGCIWTSTDGYSWTPLLTDTDFDNYTLTGVVYAANQWTAVGRGGVILQSNDGLTWNHLLSPFINNLNGIAYGNNRWVAVASGGRIATSTDGITWTERSSGITTSLFAVGFNNGVFAAGGASGVLLTSSDGVTWASRPTGTTNQINNVGVIQNTFVVGCELGVYLTSVDGISWTKQALPNGRQSATMGAFGSGNEALLIGREGDYFRGTSPTNWTRLTLGTDDARYGVLYAAGKFVAVGHGFDLYGRNTLVPISISTDGATWTRAASNPGFSTATLNALCYRSPIFVAVGDGGRIFSSSDASNWTQRTSGTTTQLLAAAASPGAFVAAGVDGAILSSIDATTWVSRSSGVSATLRGATYGRGRFVVVGDNGSIATSTDGNVWTTATSGVAKNLLTVTCFDNIGFLAAGATGTMIASTDGVTWTTVETGITDQINAIAQTPVGYVASAGTNGTLLLSIDGANWTIGSIPADRSVRGLAASGSTIVAVGDQGALLTFDLVENASTPVISQSPQSQVVAAGTSATLNVVAQNVGGGAYQWFRNGVPLVNANTPTYTIGAATSASVGVYSAAVITPAGTAVSTGTSPAIFGVTSNSKVIGDGTEVGTNIVHPNGNTFDQVLLQGAAASVTADPGQVLRISFVDFTNDIVQLEFGGAGTLSLVLDAATGPAAPINYNQSVGYMKGHVGVVVTGANETTNLSIFSVGRGNAVNQALFKNDVTYDGFADVAYVAISSTDGKFGGLRTANTSYFATRGLTGVYAPGVTFTGPVFIGDINAFDNAIPVIILGAAADTRITGGDLFQTNGKPVAVSGITQLKFVLGSTSQHTTADPHLLPAQNNRARLEQNGVDVTTQITVNP
jgi:hypothetical protein